MASIFTYQEEPPRVHSPWSTPGNSTPQSSGHTSQPQLTSNGGQPTSITKLEPERQDGPTEYKLHLLLRSRRNQSSNSSLSSVNPHDGSSRSSTDTNTRPSQAQINNSRRSRLQQLTTQLLWRLQQSSPFHSSSNADLVPPVLPEATPRLGVPDRPAKLLPGLEESQGALYEIGVADDGTLVGLVEEELEESLNNLRAMAASLGCVVDILRRVLIAQYERKTEQLSNEALAPIRIWVAEVLVRPDTKSPRLPPLEEVDVTKAISVARSQSFDEHQASHNRTEQLRIAVTGSTTAGKSSLVGTLTSSTLDNGRGKSRLSLLKHRHEIASGVTSSVAQELLGYRKDGLTSHPVVNYATGNVSSWPDIHNLASRLVFLSDSPGLPRYAKSTFRTLISWDPNWTLLCVSADEEDGTGLNSTFNHMTISEVAQRNIVVPDSIDLSLAQLEICLRLDLPLIVVITKLDIATKTGLKSVLSKILSSLKVAGRTPALLAAPSNTITNQDDNVDIAAELAYVSKKEQMEIDNLLGRMQNESDRKIVPIILTSAVTGAGIGKLHILLREMPILEHGIRGQTPVVGHDNESLFHVDEIFAIPPSKVYSENREDHSADHGIVLCGHVATGRLAVGDQLRLGPFALDNDNSSGDEGAHTPRSASYSAGNTHRRPLPRALSGLLSKSLQPEQQKPPSTPTDSGSIFLDVHIVSLRSLRLPVRSMDRGETGTVGVQPITQPSTVPLSRARKGMVLTSTPVDSLYGYRSFSAMFPASDFTNTTSPTLILGGHAIVYINSVRAAVRVTALALDEGDTNDIQTDTMSPTEFFSFDGDDQESHTNGSQNHQSDYEQEARISFRFVSSIEWMDIGNQVLVVPTVTAAGPITGPSVISNGLSGFVGRVCDVFT